MACGTGTQTFGNGDRYEGAWEAGMMSGQVLNQVEQSPILKDSGDSFQTTQEQFGELR